MADVRNQTECLKLGNLIDECEEQRYATPLILQILIASTNMGNENAKMLMKHYSDNRPKDEAVLKSIVMYLIEQNNLSKNFSQVERVSKTLNKAVKKEFNIKRKIEAALKLIVMNLIEQNNLSKTFLTDEYESETLNNADMKKFNIKRKIEKALKSIVNSIKQNKLENFSKVERVSKTLNKAVKKKLDIKPEIEESEYDLIVRLIKTFNDTKVLLPNEKKIVIRITKEFQQYGDVNVSGLFAMEYNAKDLRSYTQNTSDQVHKDHIVEIQIIANVCKTCNYNLNQAIAFTQHFCLSFNIELIDAKKNGQKKLAVTRFLKNGDTSDFVDEIKKKYCDSIRSALINSMKDKKENFDDAMKELDNLLGYDLSAQLRNRRKTI